MDGGRRWEGWPYLDIPSAREVLAEFVERDCHDPWIYGVGVA